MLEDKFQFFNDVIEEVLENPKVIENVAKLHRKMFEELINQGFATSEAIELMKYKDILKLS